MFLDSRPGLSAVFCALFFLVSPDPTLFASQPDDIAKKVASEKAALERLRRSISRERSKIFHLTDSEKSILQKMQILSRDLDLQKRALRAQKTELARNRKKIRETKKKLRKISTLAANRKALLARRIRTLYKEGEFSYFKLIFASEGVTEMMRRVTYMQKIAESDAHLFQEAIASRESLDKTRKELLDTRRKLRDAKKKVLTRKRQYQEEREAKSRFLKKIRSEKSLYRKSLKELEAASRAVRQLIRQLSEPNKNKISLLAFPGLHTKLPWPVQGKVLASYGKNYSPQYKIFTFNNGITIRSRFLTGVRAVADGKVLFADWLKGYGRLLIIGHGKGYHSLYGYLENFQVNVGSRVRKGQLIAEVGDSGPLHGPALYFEIRRRGKPDNPLKWLTKHNN